MNLFFQKHHRTIFYAAWLILGLIQAGFTELQDDEAYYWVYSKFLSWGYFDHPPMIALLVKMGYSVFPNELGVRLFPFLLNVLSLFLIERLLDKKNPYLFYAIAVSMAALQLGGFIAVPDIPLIFFTALFFLCYKNFCAKQTITNSLLLALSVALLFYTKYHAVLIVLFTVLSNLKLFTKKQFWIAGFVALMLYFPHLLWQWDYNWVSFRYHLFESNVDPYKFSYTTEYLTGQLLIAGPLAGFFLLPAALLYKTQSATERAMKWTMTGIYIFFLLSSFRGKVEVNWTTPVLVPLIVLSHQYLIDKTSWQRWMQRITAITLVLVVCMRVAMIIDIVPVKAIQQRYHAWKKWPQEMKKRTKGLPVVFSNSYQRASKYWFYTGQMTYSQNYVGEHRNNYNFWPIEDKLLGEPVYFMDIYRLNRFTDSLKTPFGYIGYRYDSACNSFAKIRFETDKTSYKIKTGNPLTLKAAARMSRSYFGYINEHKDWGTVIKLYLFRNKKIVKEFALPNMLTDNLIDGFEVSVNPDLSPGNYHFRFSIEVPGYNQTHNSEKIKLIVE